MATRGSNFTSKSPVKIKKNKAIAKNVKAKSSTPKVNMGKSTKAKKELTPEEQLKKQLRSVNAQLRKINEAYGKDASKALYNEKLKTVPGLALTKSGYISFSKKNMEKYMDKINDDSIKYLKELVDKPEELLKKLKESEDEYIQEAISRSGEEPTDEVLMKNLGKEIVAKKSLGGSDSISEALNIFYDLEIAIENSKSDILPEPEKTDGKHSQSYNIIYTKLHEEYLALFELIYTLSIRSTAISRDLSASGKKTYSDLTNINDQINVLYGDYEEYVTRREQYLNELSNFMEME